jgi:O-antigen/teichoic acid export membrane protein
VLLRQSALYMVANAVAAVIGFASVMALTRLVAPSDYGVFVVATSLGTVLATVSFTWLRHAILRFQSGPDADVRLSALAGYGLTVSLYPLALAVLFYVFHVPLAKAVVALLFAAGMSFFELGQEILRARQRVENYVASTLIRSAVSLLCCLVAIVSGGSGLTLALAMVAGYAVSALVMAPRIWQRPRQGPRFETLVTLARYGMPITLSGLFVALTLALDRFALFYVLGTEAAGIYGATAEFVRQCAILPAVSASLAIAPLAVATWDRQDGAATTRHLADGCELLLAVMLPAAVGLAIAAPQLAGTIIGPAYRETAATLIPILAFAFLAHVVSQQYIQLSFGLANQPQRYIWHTVSIFLINLVLMLPLIKLFGIRGAALSFLLSEAAGVVIGLWMARTAYALPALGGRILRIAVAVVAMAAAALLARQLVDRTDILGLGAVVLAGSLAYGIAAVGMDVAGTRHQALAAVPMLRRWRPASPPKA